MHKAPPVVSLLLSAAVIAAVYTLLGYIVFDMSMHFSVKDWVVRAYAFEFIQFACILIGVVVDYFVQKLSLKNRLLLSAAIVTIPALIFIFLI